MGRGASLQEARALHLWWRGRWGPETKAAGPRRCLSCLPEAPGSGLLPCILWWNVCTQCWLLGLASEQATESQLACGRPVTEES